MLLYVVAEIREVIQFHHFEIKKLAPDWIRGRNPRFSFEAVDTTICRNGIDTTQFKLPRRMVSCEE